MAQIERFCVRCRTQIPEKRVAGGSCFCSGECRRRDKIERRRAKAEKYCRLCHRPFPPRKMAQTATDCLPLKLRPVRRAHTLTEVLLPESIVKKRTQKMDSKLASSISYPRAGFLRSRFWRLSIMRLGAREMT